MKHNPKITTILLAMFLATQIIGLFVINHYSIENNPLPYGLETPEVQEQSEYNSLFYTIIFAFVIAVLVLFLLTKFKLKPIFRIWFFIVVTIALGVSLSIFTKNFGIEKYFFGGVPIIATGAALTLSFMKIYKREFFIHNITEPLIYPGIAAIFVPLLNIYTIIILLIIISLYDMWAVWRSGIMQKMAKYQINELKIFSGFFVPYISKKMRKKLKKMKKKSREKKIKNKKIKINMAILGGGDVIFPLITAGVILKTGIVNLPWGLKSFIGGLFPALFVIAGALLGLSYLFFFSKEKKFYPAMPFITAGIFLGIILSYLILS